MIKFNIASRIGFSVCAFGIPLVVLLYFFVHGANNDIRFTEQEIEGNAYLKPLVAVLENLGEHQLHAIRAHMGDAQGHAEMQEHAAGVDSAITALEGLQATLGNDLQFTEEGLGSRGRSDLALPNVKSKWEALKGQAANTPPQQLEESYAQLIGMARGMIGHAGDTSNLILDPDLDSYYVMDVVLLGLPQAIFNMNNLGARLDKEMAKGEVNEQVVLALALMRQTLQQDMERISTSLSTALTEDKNFYGDSPAFAANIKPALDAYLAQGKALSDMLTQMIQSRNNQLRQIEEALETAQESASKLWEVSNNELQTMLQIRHDTKVSNRNTALAALGFALAVALGLFFIVSRGITVPLKQLQSVMMEVANGDLERVIPFVNKSDEIGDMARTLEKFKQTSQEAKRLQEEQNVQNSQRAERQARIEQMIKQFETKIAQSLQSVALSAGSMHQSAESLLNDAEKTSHAAQDTANATMETSNSVSAVAAGAEELSAAINEISRQVSRAANIAQEGVSKATAADVIVQKLSQSAQKIGEIISLINTIAEQINLLALNATIESARAGEAGKGFAVVASEVKNLASQTSKATDAIAQQISDMQSVVKSVITELINIRTTIDEINGVSTTIASAVEEQGAATQEIAKNIQMTSEQVQRVSSNINDVDGMSKNTNSNAKSVLDSVKSFSDQAQSINNDIEGFLQSIAKA